MSRSVLEKDFSRDFDLLPLEQQILTQYQQLAVKLYTLSEELNTMNRSVSDIRSNGSNGQADALLTNMRGLERKMGLVYTLFRTAVYSLLLQSEEKNGGH